MADRTSLLRRNWTFALLALLAFISIQSAYGQSAATPAAKAGKKHPRTSSMKIKLQRSVVTNIGIYTGSNPADCLIPVPKPVSVEEAEEAIRSGLENLDFGIDDPDPLFKTTLDPISAKGSSDEQEHWTDVVKLNDHILKQSGTTLQELGLNDKDRIYGYHVTVRWIAEAAEQKQMFVNLCHSSGLDIPIPPSMPKMAQVVQRTIKSPKTVVRLKISVSIYERGTVSEWVERSSSYEPKPLRKLVEKEISAALNGTTTTQGR